jgi:cytochrome P450
MAPTLSCLDNLRLQWHLTLPMALGGSVAPTPQFVPRLVRWHTAARTIRFLRRIRQRYGPRAWSLFPLAWTLIVLDREGIEEVLDSDANFADPFVKKRVLSRFTPDGVIISRGDEWSKRRALNEEALAFGRQLHPDSDEFIQVIKDEVQRLLAKRPDFLAWEDFRGLAERISQQVILGRDQFEPRLAERLTRLIAGSNLGIRRPCAFSAVYQRINHHLDRQASGHGSRASLVQGCADSLRRNASAREIVDAPSQIGFWFFVINDAIGLHVSRTLALIASAPEAVQHRLLQEIQSYPALTARDMGRLHFLEACIKEQLRLWTPVPVLLRVAARDCTFRDGTPVRAGQQMLVHTGFYHRDTEVFGVAADRFDPNSRADTDAANPQSVTNSVPPLYIFSRHRQACAGQFLAMFLLKATLACLLTRVNVALIDQSIAVEQVPTAIDQFKTRFKTAPLR